ncbi:hypothetical protein Tco_0582739 [Tanacetum coccineum]
MPGVKERTQLCELKPLNLPLMKLPRFKELHHLEYAFLEGDDKLPVIIAKDLKDEEKAALLKVLKSHKRAIAWKLSDIKGVNPEFCTHKILMEEDYEPSVQSQRRVNPKIHDVIKKEVEKLLDAGLIYPISDIDTDVSMRWLACGTWNLREELLFPSSFKQDVTLRVNDKLDSTSDEVRIS